MRNEALVIGPRDSRDDAEPDALDELARLAERLEHERPVADDEFRAALRRRLERLERDEASSAPLRR